MAEISSSAPAGRGTKFRRKKLSTRIDMTPMVDLAFLLLTFFILTASFNQPTVMQLTMPDGKGAPTPLSKDKALTLILGKNGQVHYFFRPEYRSQSRHAAHHYARPGRAAAGAA